MSATRPQQIKAKATQVYVAGTIIFVAIFGGLTLTWMFFTHLKT